MWIPKDLHSHSHSQAPPTWPHSISPTTAALAPPPCPTATQIWLTLLPFSNHSPTDLVRPVSTVRSFTLHKDDDWPKLHLDVILILHILWRGSQPGISHRHRPPQAPNLLPCLSWSFRSLHPSPAASQKLISWSPWSSPFLGIETHYHVSVVKHFMRGLTLSRTQSRKRLFPGKLFLLHTPYTLRWFSLTNERDE